MTREEIPDIQPVSYAHRHKGTRRQIKGHTHAPWHPHKEKETVSLTNNIRKECSWYNWLWLRQTH